MDNLGPGGDESGEGTKCTANTIFDFRNFTGDSGGHHTRDTGESREEGEKRRSSETRPVRSEDRRGTGTSATKETDLVRTVSVHEPTQGVEEETGLRWRVAPEGGGRSYGVGRPRRSVRDGPGWTDGRRRESPVAEGDMMCQRSISNSRGRWPIHSRSSRP